MVLPKDGITVGMYLKLHVRIGRIIADDDQWIFVSDSSAHPQRCTIFPSVYNAAHLVANAVKLCADELERDSIRYLFQSDCLGLSFSAHSAFSSLLIG